MSVIGMGSNEKGQLGTGKATYAVLTPSPCLGLGDPDRIASGYEASYCLDTDGDLTALGGGGFGQQVDGHFLGKESRLTLHPCIMPPVASLDVYGMHVIALTLDGRVATAGANGYGNLGIGTRALDEERPWEGNSNVAVFPTLPEGFVPAGVSAGFKHSLMWSTDGHVLSWGVGASGALGNGTTEPISLVPTRTTIQNVSHGVSGSLHSAAVTPRGVMAWGNSQAGQCGLISRSVLLPHFIKGLPEDVTRVYAGGKRTLALTTTGDLYEVGEGNPVPRRVLSGVTDVSCAERTVLAVSDGELCAWGDNEFGQCGNGKRNETLRTPYRTQVAARAVAAGFVTSLALVS